MYLDDVAAAIEAQVPGELVPDEQARTLFRMYAVLALAKGEAVTTEDVHNAWVAWMVAIDPDHESLVGYDQLDAETQQEDSPFVGAIRAVAKDRRLSRGPGAD